jgi:hypothetical protein
MMDDMTVDQWSRTKRMAWVVGILVCLWFWAGVIWLLVKVLG